MQMVNNNQANRQSSLEVQTFFRANDNANMDCEKLICLAFNSRNLWEQMPKGNHNDNIHKTLSPDFVVHEKVNLTIYGYFVNSYIHSRTIIE